MPCRRWQKKLRGVFGSSLSHKSLKGLFFLTLQVLCIYNMASSFEFSGGACVYEQVSI